MGVMPAYANILMIYQKRISGLQQFSMQIKKKKVVLLQHTTHSVIINQHGSE